MKPTPIIILTKDNPEYLYVTLKSLTATNIQGCPIIIVDDCSSMEKTRDFLYTNEVIDVTFDDWTIKDENNNQETADKIAAQSYLNIPEITKIVGIKRKFTIIKTPKYLGKTYRTLFGINLAFELYPGASNCVILEDDILFNKDWLKEMWAINDYEFINKKIGMISSYSEIEKCDNRELPQLNEFIQGKATMISYEFYRKLCFLGLFSTINLPDQGNVYKRLEKLAYRTGFMCISTGQSYIQNLEKRNLVNEDKILKFEDNFVKPVAWNNDF